MRQREQWFAHCRTGEAEKAPGQSRKHIDCPEPNESQQTLAEEDRTTSVSTACSSSTTLWCGPVPVERGREGGWVVGREGGWQEGRKGGRETNSRMILSQALTFMQCSKLVSASTAALALVNAGMTKS